LGWREAYFATEGGIWRHDRFTGEPLDPWMTGVGPDRAVRLTGGRVILWHSGSNTLWLARTEGGKAQLCYFRSDQERWFILEDFAPARITSLGEAGAQVLIELGSGEIQALDPFRFRMTELMDTSGAPVRWSGRRGWQPHRFPNYSPVDLRLDFDPAQGLITDRKLLRWRPAYDLQDENEDRRFICYPGLGMGIVDERRFTLEIVQPGPAEPDVKALALDGSAIWVAGGSGAKNGGFSRWMRESRRWERFDREVEFGIESTLASAAVAFNGSVYFGNDLGLAYSVPGESHWHELDRFDGLSGPAVNALARVGGYLAAGGERGLNIIRLPAGPVWKSGDPRLDDLRTGDLCAEADTIWAVGVQGVFQGTAGGSWVALTGSPAMVNEPGRAVAVDDNSVWVGGSGGIRQLDRRSGQWTIHPAEPFLRGAQPLALAAADTLLWVGTTRGLYRFNRRRGSWLRFGTDQGLPEFRIQRLVLEADTLWMGTPRGLTRLIWNRPARDGL
jgi:hypothetical protein